MLLIQLQDSIAGILQKNLKFSINDKTIKEGRLLLYNIKDYYIIFTLRTPKDIVKAYEIPMPFHISKVSGNLYFNYSVAGLTKGDPDKQILIKLLLAKIGKKSKFYDNTLTIACT